MAWLRGVEIDSFTPYFTLSVHSWGVGRQKLNVTKFRNENAQEGRIPLRDFQEIFRVRGQFLQGSTI